MAWHGMAHRVTARAEERCRATRSSYGPLCSSYRYGNMVSGLSLALCVFLDLVSDIYGVHGTEAVG